MDDTDTNLPIEQNETLSPDVANLSDQVRDKMTISQDDDVEPGDPTEQSSLSAPNKTAEKCKLNCIHFQSFNNVQGKCNICTVSH